MTNTLGHKLIATHLEDELPERLDAPVLLKTGANQGHGWSRENAALIPKRRGLQVVVANNFARKQEAPS
ncbi:hypothetical protein R3F64_10045 [Halomonas sp. 5021]|uniref:hypothetical protein n=1 Tax=Halomonas sp. 5021 TaxID=3082156 RepID=UPI002FC6B653